MGRKIGLALSGGGASGLCHIGVLKVLEENNIRIDCISGVSFGALIGGLYCTGHTPSEIETIAKNTDWQRLLDFTLPINSFIRGRKIENRIRELIQNKQFHELNKKFFVVATNLETGGEVVFQEGDVSGAIRASIAIPGIIAAKKINKQLFVDGVLVDPTGLLALKNKCDVLIAVDLSAPFEKNIRLIKSKKSRENELINVISNNFIGNTIMLFKNAIKANQFKNVPKIALNAIEGLFERIFTPSRLMNILAGGISPQMIDIVLKSYQISMNRLYSLNIEAAEPDIVIKPDYPYLGFTEFDLVDEFISAGELATKKVLNKIKKLL